MIINKYCWLITILALVSLDSLRAMEKDKKEEEKIEQFKQIFAEPKKGHTWLIGEIIECRKENVESCQLVKDFITKYWPTLCTNFRKNYEMDMYQHIRGQCAAIAVALTDKEFVEILKKQK